MAAFLLRKLVDRAPTKFIRYLGNFWFPFIGAGIQVRDVSSDFRKITVCLKRRWYNANYVGTQFGGSMYAMTDPFYMLMLINNLGREYIVWDKAASIRFRRPGKADLYAEFMITQDDLNAIKTTLLTQPKMDWERDVIIRNADGDTIAEVHKVIYIAVKK